jgi:hypothetical protein
MDAVFIANKTHGDLALGRSKFNFALHTLYPGFEIKSTSRSKLVLAPKVDMTFVQFLFKLLD